MHIFRENFFHEFFKNVFAKTRTSHMTVLIEYEVELKRLQRLIFLRSTLYEGILSRIELRTHEWVEFRLKYLPRHANRDETGFSIAWPGMKS